VVAHTKVEQTSQALAGRAQWTGMLSCEICAAPVHRLWLLHSVANSTVSFLEFGGEPLITTNLFTRLSMRLLYIFNRELQVGHT
jgi:hypothetical protein